MPAFQGKKKKKSILGFLRFGPLPVSCQAHGMRALLFHGRGMESIYEEGMHCDKFKGALQITSQNSWFSKTLFSMDLWQCYEKVLLKERKVELNSDWC